MITPGEWQVSAGNLLRIIVKGTGVVICGVHKLGRFSGRPVDEAMANARLIAAAPRMLKIVREYHDALMNAPEPLLRREHDALEDAQQVLREVDGHV